MDMSSPDMQKAQANLGLIADTRGLDKLRQMGHGSNKEKAQALYMAAQQFEALLMQYWVDGMRSSNETLNPDSPLHSKYSGFFDDMLAQQQVGAMVQGNGTSGGASINKNSITYLITKQFASSLGDEGKALLAELEGRPLPQEGSVGAASESGFMPLNSEQGFMPLDRRQGGYMDLLGEATPGFMRLSEADKQKAIARPSTLYASAQHKNGASVGALSDLYGALPDVREMRNFKSPEDFVHKMMPYAVKAVEGIGMNPLVLVAQAALETGWGRHVPEGNNYYGIKAGASWQGPTQDLDSPEFEQGAMVTRNSRFRAYPSVLESMQDYVALITGNERYAKAATKSFDPDTYFDEIQKAGYATDPQYAAKLKNITRQIAFMAYK